MQTIPRRDGAVFTFEEDRMLVASHLYRGKAQTKQRFPLCPRTDLRGVLIESLGRSAWLVRLETWLPSIR